jgi:hypothetical protein
MRRPARKQARGGPQQDPSQLDDLTSGLDDLLSAASDFDADALELVDNVRRLHLDGDS